MSKGSTLGLSPERLARLFGIALDSDSKKETKNSTHTASELINAHLAGTLPFDSTVIDELPAIIGRLRKELVPNAGRTLGEVLLDQKSDLDTIKKVRIYAKKMASRKNNKAKHAMSIAIYFAAIANALLFHDVKITTHSYQSLKESFDNLNAKSWMPVKLVKLFTEAGKVCQNKLST